MPFATHFDNQRLADEIQYKSSACLRQLSDEVAALPVYAMGHGMGSLLQLLVMSKHRIQRDGAVLLSYYNRPATDVIPFLSPTVAPGLKGMGGALSQLAGSPIRSAFDVGTEQVKHIAPTVAKMIWPLFEQVNPVIMVRISVDGIVDVEVKGFHGSSVARHGWRCSRRRLDSWINLLATV